MTIEQLNAHLLGAYTDWWAFGLYVLAVLTLGVVIWGLVSLFEGDTQNRLLTYAALIVGLALVVWGALLLFGL